VLTVCEPLRGQLFGEAVADLSHAFTNRFEIDQVLYRLAGHLGHIVGVAGVGVALADPEGRLRSVTAVNDLAADLDAEQEKLREGPCVDAFASEDVVAVDDLTAMSRRWPHWSSTARHRGVHAVLGVPLRTRDTAVGAVNLYHRHVRGWQDQDRQVARLLCDLVASYVADRVEVTHARRIADQLQEALETRVLIEQAKGVLAVHHDVGVDDAFAVLRAYSRNHNVPLRSVAESVVHRGWRPPLGAAPPPPNSGIGPAPDASTDPTR
jgi:GAF domain-containing protein